MITRILDFSTPGDKPAYINYRVTGNTTWVPVPGSQPFNPPSIPVQLVEGTYYDFQFITECGPGDLSAPEYLNKVFSRYICQAPVPNKFSVYATPDEPEPNNRSVWFTWADDFLLDDIPGLAVRLEVINSSGVVVATHDTAYYRQNPFPPYTKIHQYFFQGLVNTLPPDTYTGKLTVLCPSGGRPSVQKPFTIAGAACPFITGLTYNQVVDSDSNNPNTFTFNWDLSPTAINGYDWILYDITGGAQTQIAVGNTGPTVNSFVYNLAKGKTYKLSVRAKCQYSQSVYVDIDFTSSFSGCTLTSGYENEQEYAGMGIYIHVTEFNITRIASTTPGVGRVHLNLKASVRTVVQYSMGAPLFVAATVDGAACTYGGPVDPPPNDILGKTVFQDARNRVWANVDGNINWQTVISGTMEVGVIYNFEVSVDYDLQ